METMLKFAAFSLVSFVPCIPGVVFGDKHFTVFPWYAFWSVAQSLASLLVIIYQDVEMLQARGPPSIKRKVEDTKT